MLPLKWSYSLYFDYSSTVFYSLVQAKDTNDPEVFKIGPSIGLFQFRRLLSSGVIVSSLRARSKSTNVVGYRKENIEKLLGFVI